MRGLLGKSLSHSFSKEIHEKIDGKKYNLIEVDELDSFFQEKDFEAVNVTIPYKNDVIKYLNVLSEEAKAIGSVNTIINNDDVLTGYNTDYAGLEFTLDYNKISLEHKVIGILGNGSTSRTIKYLCKQNNAKDIIVFARNPRENEYNFTNKEALKEVEVLFNATPNGMYPHNYAELLIDLTNIPKLKFVFDLVYNPINSSLILAARELNIEAVNGLMMLVHQAVRSNELMNNISHPKQLTLKIYKEILFKELNIVLIGMPMSGKSYYAKQLSIIYSKELFDVDKNIESSYNKSIPEIFESLGEVEFREIESDSIRNISKSHNIAISTGGGVVLDKQNIMHLKQNGLLLFLDMPLNELIKCNPKKRPLLKDPKNIEKLFNERYNLYNIYCDKRVVKRGFKRKETLKRIEVQIDEYLNT